MQTVKALATRQRDLQRWMHGLALRYRRAGHPGPRIVANSIPKAGTHLLTRCLQLLPGIEDSGLRARGAVTTGTLESRLKLVRGGCFIPVHLSYSYEKEQLLQDMGFAMVVIVRDPRDIAVSHFHYVSRQSRRHRLHTYYANLPDDSARLMTSIQGIPEAQWRGGVQLHDIGARCRAFMDWADHDACVVQFEKLVGPQGGGTRQEQRSEIRKIADHLGVVLDTEEEEMVATNVYSRKTSTFRKGAAGDWINHLAPEHKAALKAEAGQLLVDLGYETGYNW